MRASIINTCHKQALASIGGEHMTINTVNLTIRVDPDLKKKIEDYAKDNGNMSISSVVRLALMAKLKNRKEVI